MMEVGLENAEQNDILQDLLLKGDDLQKLSVIEALPELLETDNNATIARILPKIQQELPNSSTEFHIATSNIFKLLFEMKLSINLLRPVLQGIDSRDPIIANAWIDTLLAVISNLSHPMIMNEVLPFTLKMTQLNRTIFYRISSCKILGQIAIHPKVTQFDVKKDILPAAQSLCQDCLHEVRASMCAELPNVAKGLASDAIVKTSLLPCLVELSSDENMLVRATAVDSVVHLITFLSPNTVSTTIVPLVKKLCMDSCREGEHTFASVAKSYGILLENLKSVLSLEDGIWFFSFYRQLTKKGLTFGKEDLEIETSLALMCREYCAYNLPSITSFIHNSIPQEMDLWEATFRDLAGDPCYLVRKSVASCIQEITRILGKDSKIIVPDFVKLLRDESEEVLDALVPNISTTLEILTSFGILSVDNSSQVTIEIARALLKSQVEIFKYHNWRRKTNFLEQIECLPNCLPGDFIHQHFTQVIVSLSLEARTKPVKTQAVKTVLYYLRASTKENHRKWIRDWLLNNLLASKSCYIRHVYINMCVEALHIFSWKYFKEHFYLPLLTLGEDPVSTVRLCVVKLTPILKQMLVIPVDRNLQMKLETMVSKIEMMEKDKDVIFTLKSKLKEMRTIHGMNTEQLMEEKRKIDEEDKIVQGKIARAVLNTHLQRVKSSTSEPKSKPSRQSSAVTLRSTNALKKPYNNTSPSRVPLASTTSNEMSFLGQHFYIDAGVVLPEKAEINTEEGESVITLEENLPKLNLNSDPIQRPNEENISTVSVENVDIENMSDEDLKELETSTTNITDDVKVNLQKINKSKSMSKLSLEPVKKRNKRYSCILPSNLPIPNTLKRRSLGINPGEVSRIPVSFKSKKVEESPNMDKISCIPSASNVNYNIHNCPSDEESPNEDKMNIIPGESNKKDCIHNHHSREALRNKDKVSSIPTVNNKNDIHNFPTQLKYVSKRNSSFEPLDAKKNIEKTVHIDKNYNNSNQCVNKTEVKENIPMNSIRIHHVPIKNRNGKASGLPVLTKKARPDSAKL